MNFSSVSKYFTFIIFFLSIHSLFAQSGIIEGKILDSTSLKPREYVSVRLFSVSDSTVVGGIYTDSTGAFLLDNIEDGNYFIKTSFSGYRDKTISNLTISSENRKIKLGNIGLSIDSELNLDEIQVFGEQDLLKTGIDKKVYNVGQDLSGRGGTVSDVLNNVPSVEVDQDGNVILRGDANVTILIDGRPSSLSGGNGQSLLDAIPANSIERIEVVTNPSAKYDPDGTSGIINIVLKKNKLRGFNGMLSLNAGTGNLLNANAALSYRNPVLNVYANYSLQYREGYRNNDGLLEQYFGDSLSRLVQDRDGTDLRNSHTVIAGSDFYLSKQSTIGFSVTANYEERTRTGNLRNTLTTNNDELVRQWTRNSNDPSFENNMDIAAFYQFDFKEEKGNILASFNQSLGDEKSDGFYDEYYFNLDGSASAQEPLNQQLFNKEKNNISTGQIDYVRNFDKSKSRIEFGTKAIIRDQRVNTFSERRDTISDSFIPDTLANFDYEYTEQIYSLYGIYGKDFGKIKLQGGLRVEQAYQIPYLVSTNERYENEYFNFFPSGHLRYAYSKKSELSLSYSRRINRASARTLNPFTSYADPFNLRRGNPQLQPEFINSLDLGYALTLEKVTLTSSIFYRHTTDVIQRVKEFYADNTSAVTYKNISESQSTGLELVLLYKPVKWFKNTLSANANYIEFADDGTTSGWNNNGFNYSFKYAGVIDFWKKTASFQINLRYLSPMVMPQGIVQPRGAVDLAVEKSIQNGKWVFGARVSDLFNTQGFYMEITQPGIYQESNFKWLSRRFYVNIAYKFGKLEMGKDKPTNGTGDGGFDF